MEKLTDMVIVLFSCRDIDGILVGGKLTFKKSI